MASIEITQRGTKQYRNDKGQLHRDDGPASIYPNGTYCYFKNNVVYNDNGPCMFEEDGRYIFRPTRPDKPSLCNPNGHAIWYDEDVEEKWPEIF